MKIGEAAKQLDTTVQTLRLYETSGLIESKRTDGGTRYFDKQDMERLKAIRMLNTLGISHSRLKQLADTRLVSKSGNEASYSVAEQLDGFLQDLVEMKKTLDVAIKDVQRAYQLVEQCYGCKKSPRRKICERCEVSAGLNRATLLKLIWDQ